MTFKYTCDKCNKVIEKMDRDRSTYQVTVRGPDSKTRHGVDAMFDLCPDCYLEFEKYMKEKKK